MQTSKRAGFKRQKERIRQVNKRKEYLSKLEFLLEHAPISPFFRKQLLYEADLGWVDDEWTDPSAIDDIALSLLGISLKEDQAGIFDPQKAFLVELRYFYQGRGWIQYREENKFPTPVSWKEWEQDLDKRRKG